MSFDPVILTIDDLTHRLHDFSTACQYAESHPDKLPLAQRTMLEEERDRLALQLADALSRAQADPA